MGSPAVFEFRLHPSDVAAPHDDAIHTPHLPHALAPRGSRGVVRVAFDCVDRLAARLSHPPHEDLRGPNPIQVTRNVALSATDATDVLNRHRSIDWGAGRHACRLCVEALHPDPTALGNPWVADAVIRGRRHRSLALSVAIFDHNRRRCVVQIRPSRRPPWRIRRRRRWLASTHDAAEHIIVAMLAVDFRPPPDRNATSPNSPRSDRSSWGVTRISADA